MNSLWRKEARPGPAQKHVSWSREDSTEEGVTEPRLGPREKEQRGMKSSYKTTSKPGTGMRCHSSRKGTSIDKGMEVGPALWMGLL